MYYQFMYINMWGFRPPNISLYCIHVSVPIDAVFCCACVYLGIEMASCCVLPAKKKKKKITHASLSNFSTFLFLFFLQLDKKEMRTLLVVFPRIELIEWLTGQL